MLESLYDELYNKFLEMPVDETVDKKFAPEYTSAFEKPRGEEKECLAPTSNDETIRQALIEEGLDPDLWNVTGMRVSRWQTHDGDTRVSRKLTVDRISQGKYVDGEIEEIVNATMEKRSKLHGDIDPDNGTLGYCIFLGDLQIGKGDGGGPKATLAAVIRCLEKAALKISLMQSQGYRIGHIHIGWLGDHIEGFVSQGGAHAWRTVLTLNEQVRFMRRLMLHALVVFAPMAVKVTMAAVPGNHGEPQRFSGKGVTRYDDSHDTEALIAVHDFAQMDQEKYGHVKFYVPQSDELTVLVDVAGLPILHNHGHSHTSNKHFDWWRKQAFHSPNASSARLLVEGHLHHDHIERDGDRLWVGVGALEKESTWYRHQSGSPGWPSITGVLVSDGEPVSIDLISGRE